MTHDQEALLLTVARVLRAKVATCWSAVTP